MVSRIGASTPRASRDVQERLSIGLDAREPDPLPSSRRAGPSDHAASVRARQLAVALYDARSADACPATERSSVAPRAPRLALVKEMVTTLAPRTSSADGGGPTGTTAGSPE